MRKRIGVILAIFGISSALPFLGNADPRIAKLYYEAAYNLAASGKYPEAENVLETALQFSPLYSDALLLRSRLLEMRGKRRAAAEEVLKALTAASWSSSNPFDGIITAGRLLVDMKRYREAFDLLKQAEAKAFHDAEISFLIIKCRLGLNERAAAIAELKKASEVFPRDYRFWELSFRLRGVPPNPELFLAAMSADENYLQALAEFIRQEGPDEERRLRADEYYRLGGKDPMVSYVLMSLGNANEKEVARFLTSGGLRRMDLARKVYDMVKDKEKERESFVLSLKSFTGISGIDKNNDKIFEERFEIMNGTLRSWSVDDDQDGLDEIVATFTDGSIEAAFLDDGAHRVKIHYSSYPAVEKIETLSERGLRKIFHLGTGKFSYPLITAMPQRDERQEKFLLFPFEKGDEVRLWGAENALKASFRIDEVEDSQGILKKFYLLGGELREIEELLPGSPEKVKRRVFYSEGIPVRGERDIDSDGVIDLIEEYKSGVMTALVYDKRERGSDRYRESMSVDGLKEWDLNGDGVIDSREYRNGRGSVRREYSSLLDGIFDAVAVDPVGIRKSLSVLEGVFGE